MIQLPLQFEPVPQPPVPAPQPVVQLPPLPKKPTQKQRILARLKRGYALNIELNGICFRYGGRINELRDEGHVIWGNCVEDSVWVYWMENNNGGA